MSILPIDRTAYSHSLADAHRDVADRVAPLPLAA